jgi:hypothetical protein
MAKRVLVALRAPDGRLVGYIGIAPGVDVKLPTKFYL